MAIEVNGRTVEWKDNETVTQLLQRIGYVFPLVIVKINDSIIPRKDFSQAIIPDQAAIKVIHMVSGG
jgi:thiamine biosynthesis protein ThiS